MIFLQTTSPSPAALGAHPAGSSTISPLAVCPSGRTLWLFLAFSWGNFYFPSSLTKEPLSCAFSASHEDHNRCPDVAKSAELLLPPPRQHTELRSRPSHTHAPSAPAFQLRKRLTPRRTLLGWFCPADGHPVTRAGAPGSLQPAALLLLEEGSTASFGKALLPAAGAVVPSILQRQAPWAGHRVPQNPVRLRRECNMGHPPRSPAPSRAVPKR